MTRLVSSIRCINIVPVQVAGGAVEQKMNLHPKNLISCRDFHPNTFSESLSHQT
jgi:hypothetical protein